VQLQTQQVKAAAIRKSSDVVVSASADSVRSAVEDMTANGQTEVHSNSLLLGTLREHHSRASSKRGRCLVLTSICPPSPMIGPGSSPGSWPVAAFASVIYRQSSMSNCDEAAALANFLYWAQTAPAPVQVANRHAPPHFYSLLTPERTSHLSETLTQNRTTGKDSCSPSRTRP
jgi:hypothetical protein